MTRPYRRKDSPFWWIYVRDAKGRRKGLSTGKTDIKEAQKVLRAIQVRLRAQKESGIEGPPTVGWYFERWIAKRKARGIASSSDDETRVRLHALDVKLQSGRLFKDALLTEVSPRDLQTINEANEAAKDLAPRSILHVYAVLRVMFRQAVMDEFISGSPCVLSMRAGELPKKRDANPSWRASAVFTREEVERLISDVRIPFRRRMIYALEFLGGVRVNEITPRRWSDYDATVQPLGKLTVATSYDIKRKVEKSTTKTGVTREVPVHPTLAKMLAVWRLSGWALDYGRAPTSGDLIIPGYSSAERFMSSTSNLKRLHEDCKLIEIRTRRQHDARRTFISLGIADGARKEILKWITHTPGDVVDLYTTLPWAALCDEVSKLNIMLREGALVPLNGGRYAVATGETEP